VLARASAHQDGDADHGVVVVVSVVVVVVVAVGVVVAVVVVRCVVVGVVVVVAPVEGEYVQSTVSTALDFLFQAETVKECAPAARLGYVFGLVHLPAVPWSREHHTEVSLLTLQVRVAVEPDMVTLGRLTKVTCWARDDEERWRRFWVRFEAAPANDGAIAAQRPATPSRK